MPRAVWPKPARQVGDRWEYNSLTFWAEGGGVRIIDTDAKTPEQRERSLTLPRWNSHLDMLRNYLLAAIADQHNGSPDIIRYKAQHVYALSSVVRAGALVAKQAARQGDLTQTAVQEHYRKHVAPVKRTYQVPHLAAGAILPGD